MPPGVADRSRRHELAALDNELEPGLGREHAGDRERRELAERVAGDGHGLERRSRAA